MLEKFGIFAVVPFYCIHAVEISGGKMPKITIHQEIWARIRLFLIDSVVFFAALIITVCLYKAESTIISYVLNININIIIYALINLYPMFIAYHFISFMRKSLEMGRSEAS